MTYELYAVRTKSGEAQPEKLDTHGTLEDVLTEFFWLRDQSETLALTIKWERPK